KPGTPCETPGKHAWTSEKPPAILERRLELKGDARGLRGQPQGSEEKIRIQKRRSGFVVRHKIVERLATHNDAGLTAANEDHGRPGDLVVVRRHRISVSTGDRSCEDVTDFQVVRNAR